MKFEPTAPISSVKYWLKLAPRVTLAITAATPMMMPRVVRADRSLELPMLPMDILKDCFRPSIDQHLLPVLPPPVQDVASGGYYCKQDQGHCNAKVVVLIHSNTTQLKGIQYIGMLVSTVPVTGDYRQVLGEKDLLSAEFASN